jgi:hypothetical protein
MGGLVWYVFMLLEAPKNAILTLLFLGDIVYAPIPGMKNVILNSQEVAQELLSRRPNTTAGRKVGYFVFQL